MTLSLPDLLVSTAVPVVVIVVLLAVIAFKVWKLRPFRKKKNPP